jgi:type I restriction enzyme S subunit
VTAVQDVRVRDVLRLERREVAVDPNAEYHLIGIYSFGKGIFHREPRPGAELGDYRFFAIRPADLVLSNIQAWEGAIALATETDRGTIGTHRFLTYTAIDDRIDTNWARWFFLSESGMRLIRKAAPGTAVRNRTLAIARFEDLVMQLPPIAEQRRVAAHLDRVVSQQLRIAGIRNDRQRLERGLADALVVRATTNARVARFGDLFELQRRQVDVEPDGTYREVGLRSFGGGIFHKSPSSGAEIGSKRVYSICPNDLVISNVFGWEGALAVASSAEAGMIGSHRFMTWVSGRGVVDPHWAALYLTRGEGLEELGRASPGSAGRNRTLAVSRLQNVPIRVPASEAQAQVVQAVDRIRGLDALSDRSETLLSALIPAALNAAFRNHE